MFPQQRTYGVNYFSPILLSKYRPIPLNKAFKMKMLPKMTAVRQLTLLIENLSTILPVNSGINKPLMLPKLVIITAPIINPTGQLSF